MESKTDLVQRLGRSFKCFNKGCYRQVLTPTGTFVGKGSSIRNTWNAGLHARCADGVTHVRINVRTKSDDICPISSRKLPVRFRESHRTLCASQVDLENYVLLVETLTTVQILGVRCSQVSIKITNTTQLMHICGLIEVHKNAPKSQVPFWLDCGVGLDITSAIFPREKDQFKRTCRTPHRHKAKQMAVLSDANAPKLGKVDNEYWRCKNSRGPKSAFHLLAFKQVNKGSHNFEARPNDGLANVCGTGVHSGEARVFVVTQEFYINNIYIYDDACGLSKPYAKSRDVDMAFSIKLPEDFTHRLRRYGKNRFDARGRKWISRLKWF